MTSFLKGFDEYWRATTDTHQKLVAPRPKPAAVILPYVARQPTGKKIESAELIEERTYILASDMNLPLEWAQGIVKLQAMERPKNIPQASWLDIQSACSQLYCNDFELLKLIINHEWHLQDIYGCHPTAPMMRFDVMGLVLLLHQGDEVVGVNKERIKILRRSEKVNYLYRSLDRQMKVELLWQL